MSGLIILIVLGIVGDTTDVISKFSFIPILDNSVVIQLLSMQVTAVSTSLAIVSLVSIIQKRYFYGFSVSKFIMNDKFTYFKFKNIIILEFLLIILAYISLAIKYYNSCVAIFIASILLIIFLIDEIFRGIQEDDVLINSIKNHYREVFKNGIIKREFSNNCLPILNKVCGGIEDALVKDNILDLDESIKMLKELYKIALDNDEDNLMTQINRTIKNSIKKILHYYNPEYNLKAIEFIYDIYDYYNNYNKTNEIYYLDLFDEIAEEFFRSLANIKFYTMQDTDIIFNIEKAVQLNLINSLKGSDITFYLDYAIYNYSSRVYTSIFIDSSKKNYSKIQNEFKCKLLENNLIHNKEDQHWYISKKPISEYMRTLLVNEDKLLMCGDDAFVDRDSEYVGNELLSKIFITNEGTYKNIFNGFLFLIHIYYVYREKNIEINNNIKEKYTYIEHIIGKKANLIRAYIENVDNLDEHFFEMAMKIEVNDDTFGTVGKFLICTILVWSGFNKDKPFNEDEYKEIFYKLLGKQNIAEMYLQWFGENDIVDYQNFFIWYEKYIRNDKWFNKWWDNISYEEESNDEENIDDTSEKSEDEIYRVGDEEIRALLGRIKKFKSM